MTGTDVNELLSSMDDSVKAKAKLRYNTSSIRKSYIYGMLREACYIHLTTGEELNEILRRL